MHDVTTLGASFTTGSCWIRADRFTVTSDSLKKTFLPQVHLCSLTASGVALPTVGCRLDFHVGGQTLWSGRRGFRGVSWPGLWPLTSFSLRRLHLHKKRSEVKQPFTQLVGVSLLKPLKGVDPNLMSNLETFFTLDYPKVILPSLPP